VNNGEKRPEAAVREKLEAFRLKLFVRFGAKGAKRLIYGVPIALASLIVLLVVFFLLPIRTIEVSGDVSMFNEGEIIEAAEISEGGSLYFRSSGSIKRTIKRNLPLAKNVKVTKTLGGKVKIEIDFEGVDYYTKIGDRYYALNSELRVMDSDDKKSKYSANGAAYVRLPEVREPILGEKIVFYDTVEETDTEGETLYEVRDVSFYDYATEFLTKLRDSGFLYQTDAVVLDEKFNVSLVYDMKYKVIFGKSEELDAKFRIFFEILNEGSMQYTDKAVIDLRTISKATARPDTTLDFSEFED
jgi:hypothetical protein